MKETQKTQVQFLSQEDPLEEEMATHSSILAWEIPWTEELGGLHVVAESDTTEHTDTHTHTHTLHLTRVLQSHPPLQDRSD